MTGRYTMPNWCNPCGGYHSRDWQACAGRARNRRRDEAPAIDLSEPVDWDAYNSAGLHAGQCGPAVCVLPA